MIIQVKITFWWLISLVFIFNGTFTQRQSAFNEIKHTISIKHPGEEYVVETTLTEVQNKDGLPIEYYMDVRSVICLEEVCKVIPVTLFWNNIGEFQKYKLQKNATLEKYEADIFEPKDYKKLHTILQNQNSPFKDVFIEDIWTVPSTIHDDVDAISGATILELDEKDTVPGAALTCYTLWHWANGNIVSVIKKKTGESVSNEQLKPFITNQNETYFNIALKSLEHRNLYSEEYVNLIIDRVQKDDFLLREAFSYLEHTSQQLYLKGISELFFNGDKPQKLAVIRSLKSTDNNVSKAFYNKLSVEFINLNSFHEVSSLLELMQSKNPNSLIVNDNIMPLLASDFLIARRVYWFLNEQELTSKQKKKLRKFQKKNKEKL